MGLRDAFRERPQLGMGVASGLVVLAIGLAIFELRSSQAKISTSRVFFTVDDGATWFADDIDKTAPFTKEGKEADRAYVYDCNGKRFVSYLERATPAGLKAAEAAKRGAPGKPPAFSGGQIFSEVKKPGDAKWVGADDYARSARVLKAVCPDGGGDPQPVSP